ncbi:MAG TPA: sigma-70 family RNA polymerase sigma factor [Acidimicrobiales bacterium]|nr:sigma-70 family RNA polymerase sigma factor [Acidimicrobiales bacterium]
MTDTSGFDGFYRSNYRRVVLSLRLATGSTEEAEDLAQEAFARTLVHWARVRGGSSPLGYVYRVAFRLQRRRRLRRRRQLDAATDAARLRSTGPVETSSDSWSDGAAVRHALAQLPPACRRAAVLCLYADMTAPQAAVVLGVRPSTIRTHVQRARQALVATLAPEDHDHRKIEAFTAEEREALAD